MPREHDFLDPAQRASKTVMRRAGIIAVLLLAVACTFGLSWRHDDGQGRFRLSVIDYGWHTGIVLPRHPFEAAARRSGANGVVALLQQTPTSTFVEIGWGEASIYPAVATVDDLSVLQALDALFTPNPSVLMLMPRARHLEGDAVELFISDQGLEDMARFMEGYVDGLHPVGRSIGGAGAFYPSSGTYSMFQTCNSWTAQMLRAAGIGASPLWGSISGAVMAELRWRYS